MLYLPYLLSTSSVNCFLFQLSVLSLSLLFVSLFILSPSENIPSRDFTWKIVMTPHCFQGVSQICTVAFKNIFHDLPPTHFLTLYSDHFSIRTSNSAQVAQPVLRNHHAWSRAWSTLGNWQTKEVIHQNAGQIPPFLPLNSCPSHPWRYLICILISYIFTATVELCSH